MLPSPERPLLVIGAGKMAQALLSGWLTASPASSLEGHSLALQERHILAPDSFLLFHPSPSPELCFFAKKSRLTLCTSLDRAPPPSSVLLAVKPGQVGAAIPLLRQWPSGSFLLISVLAGIPLSFFETNLGRETPILRAMPNIAVRCAKGMTALLANAYVSEMQKAFAERLMQAVGKFCWVEEEALLQQITAISGSGPAYVFLLTEALAQAGIHVGLPREFSESLARQTVIGAGALLEETTLSPGLLREAVTSPKGTTAAALSKLAPSLFVRNSAEKESAEEEKEGGGDLFALLIQAVEAALKRAEMLQRESGAT